MTLPSDVPTDVAQRPFARILLIKPSSLGDIVHALPVLHGLRRRYPAAQIDWLIAFSCADLLRGHPEVSELVIFDRKRYGRVGRSLAVTAEFAGFLKSLRAREYDLVIDLQGLFRSGFMAFATGAPARIGFAAARELAPMFYTHRIVVPPEMTHAVDRNYRVAETLGFGHVPITFDLALTDTEGRAAAKTLSSVGLGEDLPFVAVLPGARWETKRWLPDRFAEVIDRLQLTQHVPSVLLGAPDEAPLCAAIADRCQSRPANLAGRTGLREMTALLGRAALVLCHDSAPMHLAAALGRPLVAILGPTNPARTGPHGPGAVVLQAQLPCVPCYFKRLSQCPYQHQCMKDVTSDQVLQALTETLQRGRA